MISVKKVLKIKDTNHDYTNRRLCDRKVSLTLNWIDKRFKTFEGTQRSTSAAFTAQIDVRFFFTDPAEATWFEIMFKQEMIEV